jgi:hypothetical protein
VVGRRALAAAIGLAIAAGLVAAPVAASSTWSDSGVQWHTSKPFTLYVDDQTTGAWPARVAVAAADWTFSSAADVVVGGHGKFKVGVYNYAGSPSAPCAWMTITVQGSYLKTANITLNDTCLDAQTESFRQTAICQEIGHALGMPDHRTNAPPEPSCMAPSWYGPHPIQDDFDELASLYP